MTSKFYPAFLKEYKGLEYMETPYGFCSYRFMENKNILIEDMYIVPEHRKQGKGTDLMNRLYALGKEIKSQFIIATIYHFNPDKDGVTLACLKYGFKETL